MLLASWSTVIPAHDVVPSLCRRQDHLPARMAERAKVRALGADRQRRDAGVHEHRAQADGDGTRAADDGTRLRDCDHRRHGSGICQPRAPWHDRDCRSGRHGHPGGGVAGAPRGRGDIARDRNRRPRRQPGGRGPDCASGSHGAGRRSRDRGRRPHLKATGIRGRRTAAGCGTASPQTSRDQFRRGIGGQ